MELIGKLESNDTSYIGMIPSASEYVSIKKLDQCIHMINNIQGLNGLTGSNKMQKIESLFKYQSHIHNVQRNFDAHHRGIKIKRNIKPFP